MLTQILIVLFTCAAVLAITLICIKFAVWLSKSDEIDIIVITGTSEYDGEYKKVRSSRK